MELRGKTALITGSCGVGVGRSTALRLAREGAGIVLNYGTHSSGPGVEANAREIARVVVELGGRAMVQKADTTDESQVKAMIEGVRREFGVVDILVNNAGGFWDVQDFAAIPYDHWRQVLATEIHGAFLMMRSVLPSMRERGWGRIIQVGLDGALHREGLSGVAPDYCLGKAGRAWMTTALAPQEMKQGITLNCVEPGPIGSMEFDEALRAASGDLAAWSKRVAPVSHDVAEIVAFLCSEAGRFVSGSCIRLPNSP